MFESLISRVFGLGDYRRFLLKALPENSVGCELGVWKGDFSAEILDIVKPKKLYLMDPWLFDPAFPASWHGGSVAKSQQDMDDICEAVRNRFSAFGSVELIRKKSDDPTDEIPDGSLDWVYIDGLHQYDVVLHDLRKFAGKVKPGGIVCGDDYGRGTGTPVTAALNEFLAEDACKLVWVKRHQYFLRKN